MNDTLVSRLRALHRARTTHAVLLAEWRAMQDAFFAEHAGIQKTLGEAELAVGTWDAEVRREALALWRVIPNASKTLFPGLTIREGKTVTWDDTEAMEWAKAHQMALALDTKAYRQAVLVGLAPGTVGTEVTVAVARDLAPVVGSNDSG